MRKEVGEDYPLMIKMNADDLLKGGLRVEEAARAAMRLEELGMDAFEVSGGMYDSDQQTAKPDIVSIDEEAYFRDAGRVFKERLSVPVILVGGMRSRSVMEEVLQKGVADLISLARPLIREPDLPNKLKEGKAKADCISCNGCMEFEKLDVVKCVQLR